MYSTFMYFHGITLYTVHNIKFLKVLVLQLNYCVILEGHSRGVILRLYSLPKPYVGNLDSVGILTIQLCGFKCVRV